MLLDPNKLKIPTTSKVTPSHAVFMRTAAVVSFYDTFTLQQTKQVLIQVDVTLATNQRHRPLLAVTECEGVALSHP